MQYSEVGCKLLNPLGLSFLCRENYGKSMSCGWRHRRRDEREGSWNKRRGHHTLFETVMSSRAECIVWACIYISELAEPLPPLWQSCVTVTFPATSECEWVGGREEILLQGKKCRWFLFGLISVFADNNGQVNLFTIQVESLSFCKIQISYSS